MASVWHHALAGSASELHPRLHAYFAEIPEGSVGRGRGTFEVVGTPRRWLWPVLAVLAREGVLFPVWERDVPFTVENRADAGAVAALRRFEFASGARTMIDRVSVRSGELWDVLGRHGRVRAQLCATVVDGSMHLTSSGVRLAGIPVPRWLAPRLTLVEAWDDSAQQQRVSLVLDAPAVGRIYEYSGYFTYELEGE